MCAAQSKLSPITATCIEYVHPWTNYCAVATTGLLLRSAVESFRIYSAVYTLSLLMRFRIPTLTDLRRTLHGILQSTAFLTTSAFTYSLFLCLIRNTTGSFNFFTASYVPAFMSSMCALAVERPSRRNLLCLYVSNVATETLFNMLCSRGYCHPIPHGQVIIFGASMALLSYYYRRGLHQMPVTIQSTNTINNNSIVVSHHTNKDSIYDILRFAVGKYEESVPALQLQPQYAPQRAPAAQAADAPRPPPTNRRPANAAVAFALQIVRYYSKLMAYIKHRLPRHPACPHPRDSCFHYVLSGGAKLFSIGVGVQVVLSLIKSKMSARQSFSQQVKRIFSSPETLKIGAFLGGFAAIFRLSSCSLRHLTGRDDPLYGIPAALLASIAFANYPDTTVALYVFWKALQITYNLGIEAGYLPKVPYFTFLLYSASTATLFHAALLEPTNLRSSYWKFLHSLSGGRMAVMNRLCLDAYGLCSSKQTEQVLKATRTSRNIKFLF